MPRIFFPVLLLVLVFHSLALFPLAAAQEGTFGDVADSHANHVAIEYLVSIGTLQGYEDGTFKPDNTVNRAEIMKILVKGQGLTPDPTQYKDCFPDVAAEWFSPYVCYGKAQGWVGGYPDGTFKPANTVNKVEAIKMLVNALGLSAQLPFPEDVRAIPLFDDTDSAQWYAPYLSLAKSYNLLEATSGDFDPTGGMVRAGISENIFRTLVVKENDLEAYNQTDRDAFLYFAGLGDLVGVQTVELTEEEEAAFEESLNNLTEEELEEAFTPVNTFKSFEMTARQWEFSPALITVQKGDTVNLSVTSVDVTHGFSITEFGINESLSPGEITEVEFVADQAGTFTFFCSVFCGQNHSSMEGLLVVEE